MLKATERRGHYILHSNPQQASSQSTVPIAFAHPFARHLKQVSTRLGDVFGEVPHLTGDEVAGKCAHLGKVADIVVMEAGFR
jgi:hypothetical protein